MVKDFKYPAIITICFFVFFILLYIALLRKPFTLYIGDITSDVQTSEYQISAFGLMNSYYERNSNISDIKEFPSSAFYLTLNTPPFIHNKDMCISGTFKTQDNWQLYYNTAYSDPIYRQYLEDRRPITLEKNLYLYAEDNRCTSLTECLNTMDINYIEMPSQYLSLHKEEFINNPGEEISVLSEINTTSGTNLCGEVTLYTYLKEHSYLELSTGMIRSDNINEVTTGLKAQNMLDSTVKHFVQELSNQVISIKADDISNFKEGWYTIDIYPSETTAETCIREIKSNTIYSTTEKVTIINSKTTLYSKILRNTHLIIYPELDLREEVTFTINSKDYVLTQQHTPQNPLIIDIAPGDVQIETPEFPVTILGINLAPNKQVFGTPYVVNFYQESFANYFIEPGIVITPLKQEGENSTLCFTESFYTMFNKSVSHLFEFRNLDLSKDLQEFQRLQEYNFYRHKISSKIDIWTSNSQYDASTDIGNQEVYINTIFKNSSIKPSGNIVNSDIYDYSDLKVLFKRSLSPSVFQNIRLYRESL